MRIANLAFAVGMAFAAAGCVDDVSAPRDRTPPAAPRGLFSVTGQNQATLRWLANTERDVVGYRIYTSPCASGADCPYDRFGTTVSTSFTVGGLANGVTKYFAVSAVDAAGNESDLSYETVFDTPRPEGTDAVLNNFTVTTTGAGWDFSTFRAVNTTSAPADMYFGYNGSVHQMFVPDFGTDIQDAGYAASMDDLDFAPNAGWSPTGSVELIPGHVYIVWTRDDHYAKFRVTAVNANTVTFDWAYQTAAGNPDFQARRASDESRGARPAVWIR